MYFPLGKYLPGLPRVKPRPASARAAPAVTPPWPSCEAWRYLRVVCAAGTLQVGRGRLAARRTVRDRLQLSVWLIHPLAQGPTEDGAQPVPNPASGLVGQLRNVAVGKHRNRRAVAILLDPELHGLYGRIHPRFKKHRIGSS